MSARREVWTGFRDNIFEVMLAAMLLSVLYGWDVWPRWMMLAVAWGGGGFSFVAALIGGLWLMFSRQP